MHEILHVAIITLSILALWQGAVWTVTSAARLARRFGVSELVIGLTVVAIGTSAPEFAVSIGAAVKGHPDLAIANVVGSNIFNLGFILGIVLLVRTVPTTRTMVFRDGIMLSGTGTLLLVFLSDHQLGSFEGAILLALLLGYILLLYLKRDVAREELPAGDFHWWDVPMVLLGITCIVLGAHFLVASSTVLARAAGISEWTIGISIVAVGTSMPEFVTSFVAILRKRQGISIGNLIGSDVFNLLGVLGVAAVLRPLNASDDALLHVAVLAAFMLVILMMMRTGWKLSRVEGALLLTITVFRWLLHLR
ncbi:MAG: sodium:calcium antiporter [Bacteroidia bacterium]|nr:sodium:calcium antiporter [Bacteroidia bacterium]